MTLLNLSHAIEGADLMVKTPSGKIVKRIYFNNSATPLALKNVVEDVNYNIPLLTYINATGILGTENTLKYEHVREIILDTIHGDKDKDTVIYIENATEGLNMMAYFLKEQEKDKIVITTEMEHMANYLPFLNNLPTKVAKVTNNGELDLNDLERILIENKGNVSLVTVTAVSNVTGISTDIYEIAKIAHRYGAKILVDIVQLIQHQPFSMKGYDIDDNIDFVVFSAHKCYSPLNGGALVGPKSFFDRFKPLLYGPGPAAFVTEGKIIYSEPPERFEAGYPDYFGILALGKALLTLNQIGLDRIALYERELYLYAKKRMMELDNVIIYGENSNMVNIPNLAFNVEGIYHKDVARYLVYNYGIEVGAGVAGADIYVQKLLNVSPEEAYLRFINENPVGLVRISLGMYNTFQEIDRFICALKNI